jgi:hypothetical protein
VTVNGSPLVFHDVQREAWYAPYVRFAAEQNILSGYKDVFGNPTGEFKPGGNVSIEEIAKVAAMLAGDTPDACPKVPKNVTASGSWSMPYVACAEQHGWVVFSDGTVDVKRNATRAEVIATFVQAVNVSPAPALGTVFHDVPASLEFAPAIERAHADNIVSGYTDPDGTATGLFGPDDPVTRAELSKIVTLVLQVYKHIQ